MTYASTLSLRHNDSMYCPCKTPSSLGGTKVFKIRLCTLKSTWGLLSRSWVLGRPMEAKGGPLGRGRTTWQVAAQPKDLMLGVEPYTPSTWRTRQVRTSLYLTRILHVRCNPTSSTYIGEGGIKNSEPTLSQPLRLPYSRTTPPWAYIIYIKQNAGSVHDDVSQVYKNIVSLMWYPNRISILYN
jgi:hypothetical protein